MDPNIDYYTILGVPEDSSVQDIKRAYRQMADAYHPDKVQSLGPKLQELANEEMMRINEARTILCDDESRKKYDSLRSRMKTQQKAAAPPPPPEPKVSGDITDEILATQSLIWEIKNMDVDVQDAEKLFQDAKFAYQQKDLQKTQQLLKESKKAAENARMYKDALSLIQTCRQKITEAAQLGADITKANELYSQTQPAMVNKDYMTALYYADLTFKQAVHAMERFTYNYLMDAKGRIRCAKDASLDVSKIESVFHQAKPFVNNKSYYQAIQIAVQSGSMVDELLREYTNFKYAEASAHLRVLELEGKVEPLKKLEPFVIELKASCDNADMVKAMSAINEMKELEKDAQIPKTWPELKKRKREEDIDTWDYKMPEEVAKPDERKISIYKRTLYQVWADGKLEEHESQILKNLRQELQIDMDEHKKLEDLVRKDIASRSAGRS